MVTYYLNNKGRRVIMKSFLKELYNDYITKKVRREVILNCTLLEISFKGIPTIQYLEKLLDDREVDVLEFKSYHNQTDIHIPVKSILKIEYDLQHNKIVILTDYNEHYILIGEVVPA